MAHLSISMCFLEAMSYIQLIAKNIVGINAQNLIDSSNHVKQYVLKNFPCQLLYSDSGPLWKSEYLENRLYIIGCSKYLADKIFKLLLSSCVVLTNPHIAQIG